MTEPSPDGPTVAFIHIPKTAGTSVRMALFDLLPEDRCLGVYEMAPWATPERELDSILTRPP